MNKYPHRNVLKKNNNFFYVSEEHSEISNGEQVGLAIGEIGKQGNVKSIGDRNFMLWWHHRHIRQRRGRYCTIEYKNNAMNVCVLLSTQLIRKFFCLQFKINKPFVIVFILWNFAIIKSEKKYIISLKNDYKLLWKIKSQHGFKFK